MDLPVSSGDRRTRGSRLVPRALRSQTRPTRTMEQRGLEPQMDTSTRRLPALSLGRELHSGRQPDRVPAVPVGISGSPLAPNGNTDPTDIMADQPRSDMRETSDKDVRRLVRLLHREQLTVSEISARMSYPIPTILYLIIRTRTEGYTLFAHPTVPNTTFSFIPPKEDE